MMAPPLAPPRFAAVWLGSPVLRFSMALHLAVLLGVALRPDLIIPGVVLLLVLHALLGMLSLIPRHALFGPNLLRLPPVLGQSGVLALTFDDGPDPEVTPKVLDLLDQYDMRASFFVVGTQVEAHPALAREIVRRGHSLENHTQHHFKLFSLLGPRRLWQEIIENQLAIATHTGQRARFFRPTAGFRSPLLAPLLSHSGLQLATWTRRGFDTRERDPEHILARLCRNLSSGDILLLHDGHSARDSAGMPVILTVLPRLLASMQARGLRSVSLPQALALAEPSR